jgi:iron complex transport system substrate-binding protein
MRIVSLLPSATEIVFALGRGDDLVGVTFECDYPPQARTRRVVSTSALPDGLSPAEIDVVVSARRAAGEDLYHLDERALADLRPDVILTQDLCSVCAVDLDRIEDALTFLGCDAEVVTLDPRSLEEVIASIGTVGGVIGAKRRASAVIGDLDHRLDRVVRLLEGVTTRPYSRSSGPIRRSPQVIGFPMSFLPPAAIRCLLDRVATRLGSVGMRS